MDNDDIIVSGGLGDEEIDAVEEDFEEGGDSDAEQDETPALRRLYAAHPECLPDYIESVLAKVAIGQAPPKTVSAADAAAESLKEVPSAVALDANHKTYPFLNKYESARIVGFRSNQLSQGAQPFVTVPEHVTDVREIARMELAAKRLPYIIKRPLPDGTYEYWRLQDLLQI